MFPQSPIVGIGFSLGGCILGKYLGQQGDTTPMIGGVLIGAPFDLEKTQQTLETSSSISNAYSLAMGKNLRNMFLRHRNTLALDKQHRDLLELVLGQSITPGKTKVPEPDANGPKRGTMRFIDHYIAAKLGGYPAPYGEFPFESSTAYYNYASPTNYLDAARRPVVALAAKDDPIVPDSTISSMRDCVQRNQNLVLAVSPHGGHLGYFSGVPPRRWIHNVVSEVVLALDTYYNARRRASSGDVTELGGPPASLWSRRRVQSRPVNVELLPASSLPDVLPNAELDGPAPVVRGGDAEPKLAWLRTQVLADLPLVHPRDSPAHFDESTPSEQLRLELVR